MKMTRSLLAIPLALLALLLGCGEKEPTEPLGDATSGGPPQVGIGSFGEPRDSLMDSLPGSRIPRRGPLARFADTLDNLGSFVQENFEYEFPELVPPEEYEENQIPELTPQEIMDSARVHGEVVGDTAAPDQWCFWSGGSWAWGINMCFWPINKKLVFVGSYSFSLPGIFYLDVISALYIDGNYYGVGYDFSYWGNWACVAGWFGYSCSQVHRFDVYGDHFFHDYTDVCSNKPEYWWPKTHASCVR